MYIMVLMVYVAWEWYHCVCGIVDVVVVLDHDVLIWCYVVCEVCGIVCMVLWYMWYCVWMVSLVFFFPNAYGLFRGV